MKLNNKLLSIFFPASILFMVIIVLQHVYSIFKYPSIGPDSGYYLKIAYDLTNKLNFYGGINCGYTPFVMDLFSIPFYFNKNTSLEFLFVLFLMTYIFIGIVFYRIALIINADKKISFFFTIVLITNLFVLEGVHILLEPYVLLFQLLAILLVLKYKTFKTNLLLSGFFTFLSFYSKQYGLFIIPGVLYFLFQQDKSVKKFCVNSMFFLLGVLIPVLVLAIYFNLERNLNMEYFFSQLLGIKILKGEEIITGGGYNYQGLLYSFWKYVKFLPFIFLLFLIPFYEENRKLKYSLFSIILFLGSLSILKFAYYLHYYQLIAPYTILIILSIPKNVLYKNVRMLAVLCVVFLITSFKEQKNTYNYKLWSYQYQSKIIKEIRKELPFKSKVFLQGISPAFYFLNKLSSPNLKKIGYKFPEELTANSIVGNLSKNSYLIANKSFVKKNKEKLKNFSLGKEIDKGIFILKKVD